MYGSVNEHLAETAERVRPVNIWLKGIAAPNAPSVTSTVSVLVTVHSTEASCPWTATRRRKPSGAPAGSKQPLTSASTKRPDGSTLTLGLLVSSGSLPHTGCVHGPRLSTVENVLHRVSPLRLVRSVTSPMWWKPESVRSSGSGLRPEPAQCRRTLASLCGSTYESDGSETGLNTCRG